MLSGDGLYRRRANDVVDCASQGNVPTEIANDTIDHAVDRNLRICRVACNHSMKDQLDSGRHARALRDHAVDPDILFSPNGPFELPSELVHVYGSSPRVNTVANWSSTFIS